MTGDDVSHGELQRRIVDLASTTVRKDVYDADERRRAEERRADQALVKVQGARIGDVEDRMDKADDRRRADRRLWLSSLVFPVVVGVVLLVLTALGHQ